MFTVQQIKLAHSKVKSGADFPNYIQELIKLGVVFYETYVDDGHTDYLGLEAYKVTTDSCSNKLVINHVSDETNFKIDLKAHQEGKTDYTTFCIDCAKSGIEKWSVDLVKMSCTYYDKAKNIILVESIPSF